MYKNILEVLILLRQSRGHQLVQNKRIQRVRARLFFIHSYTGQKPSIDEYYHFKILLLQYFDPYSSLCKL